MLTVSEHEDDLLEALKAGARGYVLKGISARESGNVVRSVTYGEVHISPVLASTILVELSRGRPQDVIADLTARERDILELVLQDFFLRHFAHRNQRQIPLRLQ